MDGTGAVAAGSAALGTIGICAGASVTVLVAVGAGVPDVDVLGVGDGVVVTVRVIVGRAVGVWEGWTVGVAVTVAVAVTVTVGRGSAGFVTVRVTVGAGTFTVTVTVGAGDEMGERMYTRVPVMRLCHELTMMLYEKVCPVLTLRLTARGHPRDRPRGPVVHGG